MRLSHSWIGNTLMVLVALACTEGILYDPLCWSDSLGNQLDWAASHAVIKPLPSFRSLSGLKTKAHSMVSALKPSQASPALTTPQEAPQALVAVADPVKAPAKATPKHNEPLSELRPLPKIYQANSVLDSPKAPEAPKAVAAPMTPAAPTIAATPATPAMDPALMQQMMLMNMLGNGGLTGNNGNNGGNNSNNTDPTTAMMNSMMGGDNNNGNSNGFNPMALMQLMQMQQANPAGSPNGQQNIDPEMIQTMLMGQLMNNMDFTGSSNKDNDR